MHKTGNVVVEGVAIGKIQFLNADYEEQIKRYMTGTEEEEKKRYQEAHTLAKDDLETANNTVRKIRGESVGRTENSFEIPEIDKPNKNANIETVLTELLEEPDETKGR